MSLLTPYYCSLGLGLATTSYFFYGNLGAASFGIMPVVADAKMRDLVQIDERKSTQLFKFFYKNAAPRKVFCIFASSLSLAAAGATLHQHNALHHKLTASQVGGFAKALYTASAGMLSVAAWTVFVMMANNLELIAKADRFTKENLATGDASASTIKTDPAEAQEIRERLTLWTQHHLYRIVVGGIAWTVITATAVLS